MKPFNNKIIYLFLIIFAVFFSSCKKEQYKLIENRTEDFITISDFKKCCFDSNNYDPKCHGKEFYIKGHITGTEFLDSNNYCYINDIKTGQNMQLILSSFDNQAIIDKIKNADLTKIAYTKVVAIAAYRNDFGYIYYDYVELVIASGENIWFEK